ncbi:MAG: hypothetical protein ACM3MI_13590 [Clostridiales bacterium]
MPEKLLKNHLILFFFFIFTYYFMTTMPVWAQNNRSISNLDVLYRLADSAVVGLVHKLPEQSKNIYLKTSLNNSYSVFENRVISLIKEANKNVLTIPDSSSSSVYFTIDDAKVNYPEIFRDGFFGSYKLKREISLHGSYVIANRGAVKDSHNFSFTSEDTIVQSDVKNLENQAFPFTRGEVPPEPLFSSLLEPVVALGTAAVVIYLFFSVRSK